MQARSIRLRKVLSEVFTDSGDLSDLSQIPEEEVQAVVFLHQLLYEQDSEATYGHFGYSFCWSEGGPFSSTLTDTHRLCKRQPSFLDSDTVQPHEAYFDYVSDVKDLIFSVPGGNVDRTVWLQVLSTVGYFCSPYRFGNHTTWSLEKVREKVVHVFGDESAELVNEASRRLSEAGLLDTSSDSATNFSHGDEIPSTPEEVEISPTTVGASTERRTEAIR